MVNELGSHSVFYLNPLLAGVDPALSWEMLTLYEREVHPYIRSVAAGGQAGALSVLQD
jgi:hypothetical protein